MSVANPLFSMWYLCKSVALTYLNIASVNTYQIIEVVDLGSETMTENVNSRAQIFN